MSTFDSTLKGQFKSPNLLRCKTAGSIISGQNFLYVVKKITFREKFVHRIFCISYPKKLQTWKNILLWYISTENNFL
ncbi:hypothetical protein EF405_12935 [Cyclobacteriaceae bacterium YHN15]|nr:hypothetical protein EF405_12935 [Cyclobacteriaceae bacterium YHN15]